MTTFTSFLIFIAILFLYVHITSQYKKSEDLEIYEADYISNSQIQEVCEVRQPVLFDLRAVAPPFLAENKLDWENVIESAKKSSMNVHIKDVTDIRNMDVEHGGDSVPLPLSSASGLMETDSKGRFFSENNEEFVGEALEGRMSSMDDYIKPSFTAITKRDLMFGSDGAYTPMRYHTDYRRFLLVASGKIWLKMSPWKSRKFLRVEKDYVNYEFRSPIDVWNPQEKFINDVENLKCLEFEVSSGFMLYIPPYWFYSIKYGKCGPNLTPKESEDGPTQIYGWTYNSIMNVASNLPEWGMFYLQQWNTEKKMLKKLTIREPEEIEDETEETEGVTKEETHDSKERSGGKSSNLGVRIQTKIVENE